MNRLLTIFCNLFWFANALPGYVRFCIACRYVKRYQTRYLLRLMRGNRTTEYGKNHGFEKINDWNDFVQLPLSEYKDFSRSVEQIRSGNKNVLTEDSVEILQPTSGTSSVPKLIPYTKTLGKEFKSALDAWIADLFMQRPKLFLGPQYWSISPSTEIKTEQDGKVPVGFLDDAEYFGTRKRRIMDRIMAVPSDVRLISDMEANQYVTVLFLLRLKNLRLISVWHPSFLTILLNTVRTAWPCLLNDLRNGGLDSSINISGEIRLRLVKKLKPVPQRTRELESLNPVSNDLFREIWPVLQVISCWRNGNVRSEISELEKVFPDVLIQGKGLLATEGIISIPLGNAQKQVCAVTSHTLEFLDDEGMVFPVWNLKLGKSYCVILTTSGGLYRYQLKDRIEVTDFYGKAPCIRFLGRTGVVSDCVGEKLHIEHLEDIISDIIREHYHGKPQFAMLVPSAGSKGPRYNLLIEKSGLQDPSPDEVATSLESKLCSNYHYAHARQIGQLKKVTVTPLEPNAKNRYRSFMTKKGAVAGTIKFPALCTAIGIEEYLMGV